MKEEIKKSDFIPVSWEKVLKNKKIDIIADDNQMKQILKRIGHNTDEEGFILERKKRVKANDNKEIAINELGAVIPGTKNFIRKNIASFSQFLAEHEG